MNMELATVKTREVQVFIAQNQQIRSSFIGGSCVSGEHKNFDGSVMYARYDNSYWGESDCLCGVTIFKNDYKFYPENCDYNAGAVCAKRPVSDEWVSEISNQTIGLQKTVNQLVTKFDRIKTQLDYILNMYGHVPQEETTTTQVATTTTTLATRNPSPAVQDTVTEPTTAPTTTTTTTPKPTFVNRLFHTDPPKPFMPPHFQFPQKISEIHEKTGHFHSFFVILLIILILVISLLALIVFKMFNIDFNTEKISFDRIRSLFTYRGSKRRPVTIEEGPYSDSLVESTDHQNDDSGYSSVTNL